jgi:para-aminobenzoate synthetase component 1
MAGDLFHIPIFAILNHIILQFMKGDFRMEQTSYAQWQAWQTEYNHLPYVAVQVLNANQFQQLNERGNPVSWEPIWQQLKSQTCAFVLESGKHGRYTMLGIEPEEQMYGSATQAQFQLKQTMSRYRSPRLPQCQGMFSGGLVGYFSYDVARALEVLPEHSAADLPTPDFYFARYDHIWVIDHQERKLYFISYQHIDDHTKLASYFETAQKQTALMKQQWDLWVAEAVALATDRQVQWSEFNPDRLLQPVEQHELKTSFDQQQFVDAVHKVQQYISAGDVFQVNLSVRQSRPLQTSTSEIYEWLRLLNPSPYMGYLRFPDFDLVCGSPELLIKLEAGKLTTRPIAGTRPRGVDDYLDHQLEAELLLSEKERAEHIMLVDLERNDIGRVARWGTVHVSELMTIERYSHVMHIVSQVEGELQPGLDAFDAIAATFPGGTITGAPKIRTMEIIEELEPVRRGVYTGSLGWIDYNGDMELNIIIRTLLAHEGWAHVQAGAGIVIDSIAEKEFVESLNKAKALWSAVRCSEHAKLGVS